MKQYKNDNIANFVCYGENVLEISEQINSSHVT